MMLFDPNPYSAFLFSVHDLSPLLLRLGSGSEQLWLKASPELSTSTEAPKKHLHPRIVQKLEHFNQVGRYVFIAFKIPCPTLL